MPSIQLTSVTLSSAVVQAFSVNIKYRKTSDPDVGASYTTVGSFIILPNGNFQSPVNITGLDGSTQYFVLIENPCNNSFFSKNFTTPEVSIPCGSATSYGGGEGFPNEYLIDLGTDTGDVQLIFDGQSIPDKFTVEWPDGSNTIVVDTGYRGQTSYQSDLDAALAARSLPPETITAPGAGTATFTKGTASRFARVRVFSPLPGTSWTFTLGCPTT